MATHELKTDPKAFQLVWDKEKTAEVRKADRDFMVGDNVILKEFDRATGIASGRLLGFCICNIYPLDEWAPGFCLISFKDIEWWHND